jgi:putative drug exporter of the RND superfamily
MTPRPEPPPATNGRLGLIARIAGWSMRHRAASIAGWVVLLVGVMAVSQAAGGASYASNFSLAGTDSQRARDLLARDFPTQAGDEDQIVLAARHGTLTAPAVRRQAAPMLARVARSPHVTGVVSPFAGDGARQVAADGRIAFATVSFDERANDLPKSAINHVISVAEGARSPQLRVELGGQAIEQAQQPPLGVATAIGLGAAIVILLITFGSVVAMGLPILTALLGLGTGIGLIALASQVIDMPDFSTELAVMIGLGVGIDYSLFIVTRFRENFRAGDGVERSILTAMDTAGRAVVFAGVTVIIALLGMFALGVDFLYGVAIAASLGVLMTMVAALTVLPALLSRFGDRIGRVRSRARAERDPSDPGSTWWGRWALAIRRHPWRGALAGTALMLALAAPALGLRLGQSDAGNDAAGTTTRNAYDLLAEGFGPGFNGPLQAVVQLPRANDPAALRRISATIGDTAGVASVSPPLLSARGETAVFNVYPASAPQDAATTDLVNHLRDDAVPPVAQRTGTTVLIGGPTATQIDFSHVLAGKLPLFIGIVVLLSALLLLVVFRSLVIPLQAAVMNLLSIGASLGAVVLIFQHGWLGGLIGVTGGPIEAFIPVFLFAIVFGLSMDYEVFLVSRIHEEWTRRRDASRAVVAGVSTTGRVITAAATIMVCVFLSFVTGDERVLKLFGLSLATAVFLDAFVVRSLLLPSVLELLGRSTWRLPAWLDRRLPHLAIDAEAARAPAAIASGEPAFEELG